MTRELRIRRRARAAASSYATKSKKVSKNYKSRDRVTQEERVDWALSRVRSMRVKLSRNPDDAVLRLALVGRVTEYNRERTALDRMREAANA